MAFMQILLLILGLFAYGSMAQASLPMCAEGEDNCASCYDILASQAIMSAKNRFSLQKAFFPADRENPVFLEVIYKYDVNTTNSRIDESQNHTQVWFWTDSPYYLFQPIEVIQYTSLFFADYSLRKYNVTLHLPLDCYNAREDHMLLFTQRLKLYAMKQTLTPDIDDVYIPKAASRATLKIFHDSSTSRHVTPLTFAYQIVFPFLGIICFVVFWIYKWETTTRSKYSKSNREKLTTGSGEKTTTNTWWTSQRDSVDLSILSTVMASLTACIYILVLDVFAMHSALNVVSDNVKTYYGAGKETNFSLEFGIVFLIFVEDVLIFIGLCVAFFVISFMSWYYSQEKHSWSFFVYISIAPMLCLVVHGHHILIGFIHSPYHATSALVTYGIIVLLFINSYKASYYTLLFVKEKHDGGGDSDPKKHQVHITGFICFVFISAVFSGAIVFFIAIIVLVPIDNSIDDAPAQLLSIERTVVILLAVSVAYKLYSGGSESILAYIIKARDENSTQGANQNDWEMMETEEKHVEVGRLFYKVLGNYGSTPSTTTSSETTLATSPETSTTSSQTTLTTSPATLTTSSPTTLTTSSMTTPTTSSLTIPPTSSQATPATSSPATPSTSSPTTPTTSSPTTLSTSSPTTLLTSSPTTLSTSSPTTLTTSSPTTLSTSSPTTLPTSSPTTLPTSSVTSTTHFTPLLTSDRVSPRGRIN